MDAVEFLMNRARFCKDKFCQGCEILDECLDECNDSERGVTKAQAERMVDIIEQWAQEHPVKTRQSEFLKMFPNAYTPEGVVYINPCFVEEDYQDHADCSMSCSKCRRDYWLQEVETEKTLEKMEGKKDGV